MAKDNCDLEHDMIVGFENVFIEDEYLLEETPLEESSDDQSVKVMPSEVQLINPISIESTPECIPTFVILTLSSLFQSFMDPLFATMPAFETCAIHAPSLD